MTWWALYTPLHRKSLNRIKKFLIAYSGLHIIVIYLYQINFFQTIIIPDSLIARFVFKFIETYTVIFKIKELLV